MFFLPALQEHLSEEYGISYFWNRVTNESRWDRPSRVLACAYLDSVATQVCDIFWSFLLLWLSALPIKDMAGLQHETASSRDSAAADSCHGLSLPTRAQMFVSSSQCLRPRVCVCVCVQLCSKESDSIMQGHQGCVAWPGATKLQSHIRIWSGDTLTAYLHSACDIMHGSSLCIVYPGHSLSLLIFTGYGVGLSQEPLPTTAHINQQPGA